MKVVVLAAGFATRLYPLTRDRAKPLLDIAGKPVITRLLERVLALPGISEVVVVTNGKFHGQFVEWQRGFDAGVPVRLIDDGAQDETTKRGGVGDMALAIESLDGTEPVLCIGGDNLLDFDLAPFAAAFERHGLPVMLTRELPPPVPPRRYGEVTVDATGRIVSFREKPDDPRSTTTGTCTYLFPRDIGAALRDYLEGGGEPDAPGHFIAWLVARRAVHGVPITGRWFDIGNLETLEAARAAFAT